VDFLLKEQELEKVIVTDVVRTYNQPRNEVHDHASGYKQPYDEVVGKGNIGEMIEERKLSI